MDKKIKARWVKALRSGKYKQGVGMLANAREKTYCCLGVLCDLAVKSKVIDPPEGDGVSNISLVFAGEESELPTLVVEWAGLEENNPTVKARPIPGHTGTSLVALNDSGRTFGQIANYIEKSL